MIVWFAALVGLILAAGNLGVAQQPPPIIDLHFHAQEGWDTGALVSLFDQLGVAKAGSGPAGSDSLGLSFAGRYPTRFVPFAAQGELVGRIWRDGDRVWNLDTSDVNAYLDRLESGLRSGQFKGIGEIFVNNLHTHPRDFKPIRFPADAPLMRRLWALSATYGVPVQVHTEADPTSVAEIERLLAINPQGTLIWAHTGFFAEPPLVRRLLQQHSALFCELSWRDERPRAMGWGLPIPISEAGNLRSVWKVLLEEFPERFLIGTDVGTPSVIDYARLITYWRDILAQLSPDAAEKIAHQNAERLLKLAK